MSERKRLHRGLRFGLAVFAALLGFTAVVPARADLFILNDGFVLQGKVRREAETGFYDGEMITMMKGFYFIDDGPRWILFSPKFVQKVEKKAPADLVRAVNKKELIVFQPKDIPGIEDVLETTPFNDKWNRTITVRSARGKITANQRLGYLNSYYARVDTTKDWKWYACYMTSELGPDVVRSVLANHADFKETAGMKPEDRAARRLKFCDFCVQAGWFDEADKQLNRMLKDLPGEKERVAAVREVIDRIRSRESFESIKRRHQAGQFEDVAKRLADFPEKKASEKTKSDLAELKSDYDAFQEKMTRTIGHLDKLVKLLGDKEPRQEFTDMVKVLKTEISPDGLPRLETFLSQASQAERDREKKQTTMAAANLLSLAVTGWLLGNTAAESRPDRALQLWEARNLVLDYLRDGPAKGDARLAAYLGQEERPPLDEIVQMIPSLPPARAAEYVGTKAVQVPLQGGGLPKDSEFVLQLPPEYRHSRSYPLLILLHREGENPQDMVKRWSDIAAENGVILAAPRWSAGPFAGKYTYSEREHSLVLQTLYNLRQTYNIDSDRVFLFGLGQGATMAFDVGLAHPDLFAGVIPMGPNPLFYPAIYWRNGQYLPFCTISGSCAGECEKNIRNMMERWSVQRSTYPMIWVHYKGRGGEWFSGEMPNIIDWMRGKRRPFPMKYLGNPGLGSPSDGNEYCSQREGDNHYFWLAMRGLIPACTNTLANWSNTREPAKVSARVDAANNEIWLTCKGWQEITVALGPDSQLKNLINFTRPVTIHVNGQPRWARKMIQPNLATVLEELAATGDRQRLVMAKVKIPMAGGGRAR